MNAIKKDEWFQHLKIAARTVEILVAATLLLYGVARGFGFTSITTGERMAASEADRRIIHAEIDTLHAVDARAAGRSEAIEGRLDKIERVGCVQLSIRERDLIGSCYGTPLSPERIRKVP